MTKALQQIVEKAGQLPPETQDAIAAVIDEQMQADHRWQQLLCDPRSPSLLRQLSDDALAEHRHGQTRDLETDNL